MFEQLKNSFLNNNEFKSLPLSTHCRLDIESNYNSNIVNINNDPLNELLSDEQKLIENLQKHITIKNFNSQYITNKYNILRWIYAYPDSIEIAAQKYQRHLRIRSILRLDNYENWTSFDGVDDFADIYAPITICGKVILNFKKN